MINSAFIVYGSPFSNNDILYDVSPLISISCGIIILTDNPDRSISSDVILTSNGNSVLEKIDSGVVVSILTIGSFSTIIGNAMLDLVGSIGSTLLLTSTCEYEMLRKCVPIVASFNTL